VNGTVPKESDKSFNNVGGSNQFDRRSMVDVKDKVPKASDNDSDVVRSFQLDRSSVFDVNGKVPKGPGDDSGVVRSFQLDRGNIFDVNGKRPKTTTTTTSSPMTSGNLYNNKDKIKSEPNESKSEASPRLVSEVEVKPKQTTRVEMKPKEATKVEVTSKKSEEKSSSEVGRKTEFMKKRDPKDYQSDYMRSKITAESQGKLTVVARNTFLATSALAIGSTVATNLFADFSIGLKSFFDKLNTSTSKNISSTVTSEKTTVPTPKRFEKKVTFSSPFESKVAVSSPENAANRVKLLMEKAEAAKSKPAGIKPSVTSSSDSSFAKSTPLVESESSIPKSIDVKPSEASSVAKSSTAASESTTQKAVEVSKATPLSSESPVPVEQVVKKEVPTAASLEKSAGSVFEMSMPSKPETFIINVPRMESVESGSSPNAPKVAVDCSSGTCKVIMTFDE
jgi:hypothetical protein